MKYLVHTVDADELPGDVPWLIVEREDQPPLLFVTGDVAQCWRFLRCWEDTLEPSWQPTVSMPLLRLVV